MKYNIFTQPWWSGECGHYALLRCLEWWDTIFQLRDVRKATGVSAWKAIFSGVDQDQLIKGIQVLGLTARVIESGDAEDFRHRLESVLSMNQPLILSVHDGGHWVCLWGTGLNADHSQYFRYIDSRHNIGNPQRKATWAELLEEMDTDDDFYAIAVAP